MFWDSVAGVYDIFVNVINRKTHRELKKIVAGLIGPGDRVLECACGTGLLTGVIADKCSFLAATDFSEKMLLRAKKNCSGFTNITFARADITALDFPDGSFDKVVAGNVIHLLDDPLQAMAEMDRVCRDGGTLIIATYMNQNRRGQTSRFASAAGKAGADFKRQFTADTYKAFFTDAGYSDAEITVADGRIPCAVAVMRKAGKR
ncbi:MAG: methyltransferase domain-containing protein [Lachnospiraceae bacterium]|nr:methyltransferase domain-containing protein [Lachnospiraceae bacterium]